MSSQELNSHLSHPQHCLCSRPGAHRLLFQILHLVSCYVCDKAALLLTCLTHLCKHRLESSPGPDPKSLTPEKQGGCKPLLTHLLRGRSPWSRHTWCSRCRGCSWRCRRGGGWTCAGAGSQSASGSRCRAGAECTCAARTAGTAPCGTPSGTCGNSGVSAGTPGGESPGHPHSPEPRPAQGWMSPSPLPLRAARVCHGKVSITRRNVARAEITFCPGSFWRGFSWA